MDTLRCDTLPCDALPCDARLSRDARLRCDYVPNLGSALLIFQPGSIRWRGRRLELVDVDGVVVDARSWPEDVGFTMGRMVEFPCHLARIAAADRWGEPGAVTEVSNGDRVRGERLLDRRIGSPPLPPPLPPSQISSKTTAATRRSQS